MQRQALLERLVNAGVMTAGEAVRAAESGLRPSAMPTRRSFDSAQVSLLTSSWTTVTKPIDADIRNSLRRLRARSRHEAQNNDYVRRFLGLVKTNVVGPNGIVMQPRIIDPAGQPDPVAGDAILEAWKEWGRKGSPDVTGRLSWKMIQRQFIETLARDGEVLIRKYRKWSGNRFRFALQFLDPEVLDVNLNRELRNGNVVRMGVEMNALRRPVAYHVAVSKPAAHGDDYVFNGRRYERIPATEIIHEYLPEWVWQTRGVPWVTAGLLRLNMLGGYEEAELVASRASAAKFAVYEKVDEEAPTMNPGVAADDEQAGTFIQDFDSGTVEISPEGYRLNLIDPQHPNSAYKDFVKTCLRGIASGLGVNYNSLANDLEGVNYNSLRKGALDERDVWMMLQDWMVEAFCRPVYEDWLDRVLMQGEITIAGKPLKLERRENYLRVLWQPRRWQWVDPLKELNAHKVALDQKLRSPQSIIREMGYDPQTVLEEWTEWQQQLDALGLTMVTDGGTPMTAQENANE